jgi:hypothetical protein
MLGRPLSAALIAVVILAASRCPGAEGLRVEAEDFAAYGSCDLGGLTIGSDYCSTASGFEVVTGLDLPGEWIRLKVTFPAAGCYRSSVAYQAAYADTVVVRVRVVDGGGAGTPLTAHYTLSDGWGFG